jgi:tetratricopeptide (TPR) repeat protein
MPAGTSTLDLAVFHEQIARALRTPVNRLLAEPTAAVAAEQSPSSRKNRPAALSRASAALAKALNGWEGVPLAGIPGPFAAARRIQLRHLQIATLERRLEIELELGEYAEAVARLPEVIAENPLRERLQELLMLALYRAGRQAEALSTFEASRRRMSREHGVGPGPGLQALHQRILRSDPDLLEIPAPKAAGPTKSPAVLPFPAQLPREITDFTGRAGAVEVLTEALRAPEQRPVVVIDGGPGVGKSAVAARVARLVRESFPDGQVYADLGGQSDDPADPATVLTGFLRAFGVPAGEVPATLNDLSGMWTDLLSRKRILIVLDQALDRAQVAPLLPRAVAAAAATSKGKSAVLITSRHPIADPRAHWHRLDPLTIQEGVALLTAIVGAQRVGAEPAAARRLVEGCGGEAGQIRRAAVKLATRPDWSIEPD